MTVSSADETLHYQPVKRFGRSTIVAGRAGKKSLAQSAEVRNSTGSIQEWWRIATVRVLTEKGG
jgi:hypothetical protein